MPEEESVPEKVLSEKLQKLTVSVKEWESEHPEISDMEPEELYLEPRSVKAVKAMEDLKQIMIDHRVASSDYLETLSYDPNSYISVSIGICLDVLPGVNISVLEKAANSGHTIPLILLSGRVREVTNGTVDDSTLYNLALISCTKPDTDDAGNKVALAEVCQQFPGVTLDRCITDIETRGIEFPYWYYIKQAAHYAGYQGHKLYIGEKVKDYLLKADADVALPIINELTGLSPEEITEIYRRANNIFVNLEGFLDSGILSIVNERFTQLSGEERRDLITEALLTGKYKTIKNIVKSLKGGNALPDALLDLSTRIKEEFERQFDLHNYLTCRNIVDCLNDLETELPDRQKLAEIDTQTTNLKNEARTVESYGEVDVSKEAIKFYLAEWMNYRIRALENRLENPGKEEGENGKWLESLEFSHLRDRIEFSKLNSVRIDAVRRTFSWMQKYLAVAVNSELRHQNLIEGKKPILGEVETLDIFSGPITPEQVRIQLKVAEHLFENYQWQRSFGGKKWAEIARLALKAWSIETEDINMQAWIIDRAFDIQHNTGSIFDKDPNHIKSDSSFRLLLDAKFGAKSEKGLIEFGETSKLLDPEDVKMYEDAFESIKNLECAQTRPKGYE